MTTYKTNPSKCYISYCRKKIGIGFVIFGVTSAIGVLLTVNKNKFIYQNFKKNQTFSLSCLL